MSNEEKGLNILGIIFGAWFLLTSWNWTFNAALYISYPIGLMSLLMLLFSPYQWGKKSMRVLLILGLITSITALMLYR